ncbi:MAG: prolipoprotein diacylglyceryl transferase [Acidobacteriota bacterium]
MMPVLFTFKLFGWDIALPTYGLLLAIGFLLALLVAIRQARREGVPSDIISDLWIISLLSGVLGAKLLLYLLDFRYYVQHPSAILSTLRSAGVWYGGLILAVAACLVAVRRRGLDAWLIGDILAPAIILGQAVGRLGCFAAGCCYGKPTGLAWAVTFTSKRANEITGVPLDVPLHPTQLYHSAANLLGFLILMTLAARKRFRGQVLLVYLIYYAVVRAILEIFRDDPRGSFAGLSTSQLISIIVGLVAVVLYVRRARSAGARPFKHDPRQAAPAR